MRISAPSLLAILLTGTLPVAAAPVGAVSGTKPPPQGAADAAKDDRDKANAAAATAATSNVAAAATADPATAAQAKKDQAAADAAKTKAAKSEAAAETPSSFTSGCYVGTTYSSLFNVSPSSSGLLSQGTNYVMLNVNYHPAGRIFGCGAELGLSGSSPQATGSSTSAASSPTIQSIQSTVAAASGVKGDVSVFAVLNPNSDASQILIANLGTSEARSSSTATSGASPSTTTYSDQSNANWSFGYDYTVSAKNAWQGSFVKAVAGKDELYPNHPLRVFATSRVVHPLATGSTGSTGSAGSTGGQTVYAEAGYNRNLGHGYNEAIDDRVEWTFAFGVKFDVAALFTSK
jgi:hypothetical protein